MMPVLMPFGNFNSGMTLVKIDVCLSITTTTTILAHFIEHRYTSNVNTYFDDVRAVDSGNGADAVDFLKRERNLTLAGVLFLNLRESTASLFTIRANGFSLQRIK